MASTQRNSGRVCPVGVFSGSAGILVSLLLLHRLTGASVGIVWPNSRSCQSEAICPEAAQLLQNLHVTVTFSWNIRKLAWLQQVVAEVLTYPTQVKMVIICNRGQLLQQHLNSLSWRATTNGLAVFSSTEQSEDPLELGWAHRSYIAGVVAEDDVYTAFLHVSDDMLVPWGAMVGWAEDTLVLEPLGLQRGFLRLEVEPWSGRSALADQWLDPGPTKVTDSNRVMHINSRGERDAANNSAHHFVNLPNMFQGMWVASRSQLTRYMASQLWELNSTRAWPERPWGLPEMAEGGVLWLDAPKGYNTAAVVPFDPASNQFPQAVFVHHLPNRLCSLLPSDRPPDANDDTGVCRWEPGNYLV